MRARARARVTPFELLNHLNASPAADPRKHFSSLNHLFSVIIQRPYIRMKNTALQNFVL